ncbi:hypothetical protein D3C73_876580 [compost metagenome]
MADRRNVQHPAAGRYQLSVLDRRAGVEDLLAPCCCRQFGDWRVLVIGSGITLGCHDDAQRHIVAPQRLDLIEGAGCGGIEQFEKIALQPHHQHLAFRVAEADIVFDQFRTLLGDHQAGKEHAGERMAAFRHAADGRLDNFLHRPLDHFGRHHRGRGIGAHAARVRSGIAVAHTLVVLRGCQRQRGLAVGKAEEACLFAIEIGLDHDFRTGCPEGAVEAVVDCGKCFFDRHCHGDTLAGGKSVCLDHDRRALLGHIGLGFFTIGEAAVGSGRDIVAGADILGETLGAFELGCRGRWSKDDDVLGTQHVGDTGHQRSFRTDHDEVDTVV